MSVFGTDSVSRAGPAHPSWGSVNTEWTGNVTVFPAESPKGKSLTLGAEVAVGGSVIDELIFEVGTLYAWVNGQNRLQYQPHQRR